MLNLDAMDYSDVQVREVSVTLPGGRECVLREASGSAAAKWYTSQANGLVYDANGRVVAYKDIGELESLLVSLCLFDKAKNTAIQKAEVQKLPSRLQTELFKRALEISDMKKDVNLSILVNEVFTREDSPISLEDLRKFLYGLEDKKFKPVVDLFTPTDEELAKNSQRSTTPGSD